MVFPAVAPVAVAKEPWTRPVALAVNVRFRAIAFL
jgi:hypothetical protein